jgi:putative oxidoreductase
MITRTLELTNKAAPAILPSLGRFVFAAVLLFYFWNSALTKIGPGPFGFLHPSVAAYAQIFPKTMESVGFDISQLGLFHWAVAVAGTVAEFALPAMIVLGLLTRLAALGMVGFVLVQSWVDIHGHGVSTETIGRWFDGPSDSALMDQRALWMVVFAALILLGGGPLSLDRLLFHRLASAPSQGQSIPA